MIAPPQFFRIASNISYTIGGVAWLSILGFKASLREAFFALLFSMGTVFVGYIATHWMFRDQPFRVYAAWLSKHGAQIDVFAYAVLWLGGAIFVDPWYSSGALAALWVSDEAGMALSRKWLDAEHRINKSFDDEDPFS